MNEPLKVYLRFLEAQGVPFEVAPTLSRHPDHDEQLLPVSITPRRFEDFGEAELVEHYDHAAGLGSDHASHSIGRLLLELGQTLHGCSMLELGCGTGFLATLGARLGAAVVATDVDARALKLAARTVQANEVEVELREGSLCAPLRAGDRFELCVANLPHKPAPKEGDLPISQWGGPEGDLLFERALTELRPHLAPGARLLFTLHSLPHPRLLRSIAREFALELRAWKLRWLQQREYPNLRDSFRLRHEQGRSLLWRDDGREAMVMGFWLGTLRAER